jgi:hypothetical protein
MQPLSAAALELPERMPLGVSALVRLRSARTDRRIKVPPMSADWLLQSAVKSGKRGDSF